MKSPASLIRLIGLLCCSAQRDSISQLAATKIRLCRDFVEKTSMRNSRVNLSRILNNFESFVIMALLLVFAMPAPGQTKAAQSGGTQASLEQKAELNLKAARENPLQLRHFLLGMPKGGDLHNHLSGAVYAESWIRAAAEDHLCVEIAKLAFAKPAPSSGGGAEQPTCGDGRVPVTKAFTDQDLYDALVDAFSMRGFVPLAGVTAHDH